MSSVLRLKMKVESVIPETDENRTQTGELLSLRAVYEEDGPTNAEWSKFTPAAQLTMTINNPQAFGRVMEGDFVMVDLTPTDQGS